MARSDKGKDSYNPDPEHTRLLAENGVYLGTSGYSYDEWKGLFYPEKISKPRMLEYYAERFSAAEANYSYYRAPNPKTVRGMMDKAPGMTFSFKAHRSLTHYKTLSDNVISAFRKAVEPVRKARRFAAIVFQFPQSFSYDGESMEYLEKLFKAHKGMPMAVEFRNASWKREDVFELCDGLGCVVSSTDEPEVNNMMGSFVRPGKPFSYYRFHGRNDSAWTKGGGGDKYYYDYKGKVLDEIAANIVKLHEDSETVYVFANNTAQARAAQTLRRIAETLIQRFE